MTFTKVQSGFVDLTTSSGLTVGAGNASTPALNFSDNSTGFFRSGSNEIAISLSGSQKFTFKNDNFGIGTNSPDVPLVVVGNTKISGNTHIGGASGSGARLSVYRSTQYASNPVFEVYSNHTGNAQTKIFEVDGDGSILVNGGGTATAGTLELRQRGETVNDGIGLSSNHATAHRIWKNSAGRFNIGTISDSDQLFITQAAAPNGYIGLNKPTRFGAGDGGPTDYGAMGNGTLSTDVTQQPWYTDGGRHYIHFDINGANNESNTQDPAYIAWKGSVSSSPNTVIPNGGYMARIGGYRDLVNNGSTSLCWESVHDMDANPHLPTRNLTLRYNGRIGFGNEIEPACVVDMSQDTTAICLPKGTTAQRSGFTNEAGQMRYNTDANSLEYYNGTSWRDVTEGAITSTSGDYVTTSGGYKFHFFHQSGSFVNSGGTQVAQIYVIGAGGGGGGGTHNAGSGGGGGGGMAYGTVNIPNGTYTVTVGAAGAFGQSTNGSSTSTPGSAGGTSSIVIGSTTFQATGGGGGLSDANQTTSTNGGNAANSSGAQASTGGSGGTGTINGGTSYTGPDGTSSVFGTGGAGGFGGSLDSSNNGQNNTAGGNGTNGGAGGGAGGQNNGPHNGNGGNGSSTYYTGGGGGGAYDNDGDPNSNPTPANSLDGGTGYFNGGTGGDMNGTTGAAGGKPTGSAGTNYSGGTTSAGTTRFNNGGGGGAYGGGGGGAADAQNSTDASGGAGGSGVVIIKYSV